MEDLFHSGPPFPFVSVVEGLLAGNAKCPPFLSLRVGCHEGVIGGHVGSYVFEVAKEVVVSIRQSSQEDGVVANAALGDLLKDLWPDGRVQPLILFNFLFP